MAISLNTHLIPTSSLAIAVSGGCDSMALAFLVKKQFPNLDFIALIVDHKFRYESTKEANQVKKYLEKNGVNSVVLSPANQTPSYDGVTQEAIFADESCRRMTASKKSLTNLLDASLSRNDRNKVTEESLRNLRYSLITEYCKKHKIKNVFTAHHLDDNIETFLMRLERGSGLQGLASIKEISKINGINFIRPLLNVAKDELKDFLIQNKLKWFEDPSNESDKFTRNRLRKSLSSISDYNLIQKRLSGVIENINRAENFIEQEEEKYFKKICKISEYNFIEVNQKEFLKLHEEIAFRIIKRCLSFRDSDIQNAEETLKSSKNIRFENIKTIYNKIHSEKSFSITCNNLEILFEGEKIDRKAIGKIYFFPELSKIKNYEPLGEKGLSELKKNKKIKLPKLHFKILRTLHKDYFYN